MESKLGLNFELVDKARASAAHVAADVQGFINEHTTVTTERAVCRLLGIDGVNEMDVPMPNVVVDHLMANGLLPVGASWHIGNAMVETSLDPQAIAEKIDKGEIDLSKLPAHSDAEIRKAIKPCVDKTIARINKNVGARNAYLKDGPPGEYLTDRLATDTISYLASRKVGDKPFFAFLSFYAVHTPVGPAPSTTTGTCGPGAVAAPSGASRSTGTGRRYDMDRDLTPRTGRPR